MADDLTPTPSQSKSRGGRPPRAEASRKALANVDANAVDPLQVLKIICSDPSAPAAARVSAARTLLGLVDSSEVRRAKAEKALRQRPTKRALEHRELLAAERGTDWGSLVN